MLPQGGFQLARDIIQEAGSIATTAQEVRSLDIVNIGIVGFAHPHVHGYLRVLLDRNDVCVLGGWDEDLHRAANVLETSGLTVYPTLDALLSSAIDAVVVCSENVR